MLGSVLAGEVLAELKVCLFGSQLCLLDDIVRSIS